MLKHKSTFSKSDKNQNNASNVALLTNLQTAYGTKYYEVYVYEIW